MLARSFVMALAIAMPLASALSTSPNANQGIDHPRSLKREDKTPRGKCNGTSCKIKNNFLWFSKNYACDRGSCVGEGAGDGADCERNIDFDATGYIGWNKMITICPGRSLPDIPLPS